MRIGALTAIEADRVPLASAFIKHYMRWCDPEDIHIMCQRDDGSVDNREMRELVEGLGANFIDWTGRYSTEDIKTDHAARTRELFSWGGWHFNVDSDEFFDRSVDVPRLCAVSAAMGKVFVRTLMVDRVAADGSFPELQVGDDPYEIYGEERDLTGKVVRGYAIKDCLLKNPYYGHHNAWDVDLKSGRAPGLYKLHHFKWDSLAVERMRLRCHMLNRERFPYWRNFQYFVDYYDNNNGRMDMSDESMFFDQSKFAK